MANRQLLDSVQFLPKLEAELLNCTSFLTKLNTELPNASSSQWTNFTPVVTSGSGTLTSKSATMSYNINAAKILTFEAVVTITTNGTGAGFIQISLPVLPASGKSFICPARVLPSGNSAVITIEGSAGIFTSYNNAYVGGDGVTIKVSGSYKTV